MQKGRETLRATQQTCVEQAEHKELAGPSPHQVPSTKPLATVAVEQNSSCQSPDKDIKPHDPN